MIVSKKIFVHLEQNKMTQKEFSERTGISQSTISDWKRKKTNPSADKILKICEVLGTTPYELLSEEDTCEYTNSIDHNLILNKEENTLLESYRKLDNRQKERLMGYLCALSELK